MYTRQYKTKKASANSSDTTTTNQFAPRRFIAQPTEEITNNQTPDLQTQLEKQSGNSLRNIPVFPRNATQPQPPRIQMKLTIGQPDDKYEREANRLAADVVQRINAPESEKIQRQELPEDDDKLQMKPIVQRLSVAGGMAATSDLEESIQQARSSGQPLTESIREPMEQAFGADFSGVKIHTDAQSDKLNQSIQAKAFTTGQDIFFRQGEYQPESRGGQELLAHELTHVVQQNGGAVQRSVIQQPQRQEQFGSRPSHNSYSLEGYAGRIADGVNFTTQNVTRAIQRTISLNSGEITRELSQELEMYEVYKVVDKSPHNVKFKDVDHLRSFILKYKDFYDSAPDKFNAQLNTPQNITKIDSYTISEKEEGAELKNIITLQLEGGSATFVEVFVSMQRHLLDTLKADRGSLADAKTNNSLVGDESEFRTSFVDYAKQQAEAILKNTILMGYNPRLLIHQRTTVPFASDVEELPKQKYDRENPIHSYPAPGGSEVIYPNQNQMYSLSLLLAHCYHQGTTGELENPRATAKPPASDPATLQTSNQKKQKAEQEVNKFNSKHSVRIQDLDAGTLEAEMKVKLGSNEIGKHITETKDMMKALYEATSYVSMIRQIEPSSDPQSPTITVDAKEAKEAKDALASSAPNILQFIEKYMIETEANSRYTALDSITEQPTTKERYKQKVGQAKATYQKKIVDEKNLTNRYMYIKDMVTKLMTIPNY